jgi:hypothetical protein
VRFFRKRAKKKKQKILVGRRLSGASHFFSFLISVISSSSLGWRETTGEKQAGAQEGGDSAHAETDISRRCCDDELPAN